MIPAEKPIMVDLFAGGGGVACAMVMATGSGPDVAVNHDPKAVAMHAINHPGTLHVCQDVWGCPPRWAARGRKVAWLHGSPDCTHFSKAKGSSPNRDEKRRDLAWVLVKWIRELLPNCVSLENVEEFLTWGPCDRAGVPIKSQAGASFRSFVAAIRRLGYKVEWRELRACDYGAPTIRKRLFLIARRDHKPIVWPTPTHGDPKSAAVKSGKMLPWRTAAECIDFSHPCPSIFERTRPLADATLHRIAEGIKRYVVESAHPYIVGCGGRAAQIPPRSIAKPFQTITAKADSCLVTPFLTEHANASSQRNFDVAEPLRTQCAQVKGGHFALVSPFLAGAGGPVYAGKPVSMDRPFGTLMTENHQAVIAPTLIQTGYGEREGQAPRTLDLHKPLGTVVSCGQKHALVPAFLAKHYGGVVGQELEQPIGTVTTVDHHSLVAVHVQRDFGNSVGHAADEPCGTVTAGGGGKSGVVTSHLVKLRGTCKDGQPVDAPAPTITSGGTHVGEVRACLMKFYGEGGQHSSLHDPMHTIPTKDRMAVVETRPAGDHAAEVRALLHWHRQGKAWGFRADDFDGLTADAFAGEVVLGGEVYTIADIGMRMLQPRELYRAQGFPDSYIIGDDPAQGLSLTKAEQVRMCGNSVCPPLAAALIAANYTEDFATARETRALPLLGVGV